jgi:Ser/Thr protein kinase RdoA (MazF antagonist)
MTFRYRKSIDRRIQPAVESALDIRVLSVSKIKSGEVNHVYKVETDKKAVLVRVFRYENWPEKGKLEWIEKQFVKHRVPHAKLLFLSRRKSWFPNGFMITEFIRGKPADEALRDGNLSKNDFYRHLGRLLEKVHRIRLKKFGDWHGTYGTDPDLLSFVLPRIPQRLDELKKTPYYNKRMAQKAKVKVASLLMPMKSKLKPVLTHGDPGTDNCIWSNDKKLILIDWDNARSSAWVRDYADRMWWESWAVRFMKIPQRQFANASKSFLKGYGKTGFTKAELDRATSAFFIIQAVNLLPYYYFDQRNMDAFRKTGTVLKELLA